MPNDDHNKTSNEQYKPPLKAFLVGLPCAVCDNVGFSDKAALARALTIHPDMTWVCSTECAEKIQKEKFPYAHLAEDLLSVNEEETEEEL